MFGDRASKEVNKSEWVIRVGPWSDKISGLMRGDTRELPCSVLLCTGQRKGYVGTQQECGCLQGRMRGLTSNSIDGHFDMGLFGSKSVRK